MIASIDQNLHVISSACLLRAVIDDSRVRDAVLSGAPDLAKLPRQRLADDLAAIVAQGHECRRGAGGDGGAPMAHPNTADGHPCRRWRPLRST